MARQAGEKFDARKFEKYLRDYDLTEFGAGSQKDPPANRLSAFDVRELFKKGLAMGATKSQSAEGVLDYAADKMGRTKMGGGTARALDKLRGYREDGGESDQPVSVDPIPADDGIPVPFPVREEEATYAPFRGSYFDFVGGDPSNPADYYMGDPDRGGATAYFGDERFLIEDGSPAGVVPDDMPSFMAATQNPAYLETFGYGVVDDEEEDKGYETEEDRVSKQMAAGIPTIANQFASRAMGAAGLVS